MHAFKKHYVKLKSFNIYQSDGVTLVLIVLKIKVNFASIEKLYCDDICISTTSNFGNIFEQRCVRLSLSPSTWLNTLPFLCNDKHNIGFGKVSDVNAPVAENFAVELPQSVLQNYMQGVPGGSNINISACEVNALLQPLSHCGGSE